MKKNGQYVGVDEKYIPEEEKYVDDTLNSEIKGMLNDGIKSAKDYVSDKDNKEKIKKTVKKGLKVLKGVGIGYLALIGFVFLVVIVTFITVFSTFFKTSKQSDKIMDEATNIIDNVIDKVNDSNSGYSQYEISSFNKNLETFQGTKYGSSITSLLDNVVTKIKKNNNHSISVVYDNRTISNTDDIISIKKEIDNMTKYEVSFDYDSDGFINKVTIEKY